MPRSTDNHFRPAKVAASKNTKRHRSPCVGERTGHDDDQGFSPSMERAAIYIFMTPVAVMASH